MRISLVTKHHVSSILLIVVGCVMISQSLALFNEDHHYYLVPFQQKSSSMSSPQSLQDPLFLSKPSFLKSKRYARIVVDELLSVDKEINQDESDDDYDDNSDNDISILPQDFKNNHHHCGAELRWIDPLQLALDVTLPSHDHQIIIPNNYCQNTIQQHTSHSMTKKMMKKTGTTIAGCICARTGHVILAADTRATAGTMVADKYCEKIHCLATNVYCCGAGTSADLDHVTRRVLYTMTLQQSKSMAGNANVQQQQKKENEIEIEIKSITNDNNNTTGTSTINETNNKKQQQQGHYLEDHDNQIYIQSTSVDAICHVIQDSLYGGSTNANLILGGVYNGKSYLRALHPHGSMDVDLPFAALGSGGLAAMGVLEQGYPNAKDNLQDCIQLVKNAILAGIKNDLGSGSQVDLVIMDPTTGESHYQRCVVPREQVAAVMVQHEQESVSTTDTTGDSGIDTAKTTRLVSNVNGFGNSPFLIQQSKSVETTFKENDLISLAQQESKWNKLLGF